MYKHYSGLSILSPTNTKRRKQRDQVDSYTVPVTVRSMFGGKGRSDIFHLTVGPIIHIDRRKIHHVNITDVLFGCNIV